jgi:hypothetical protein
MPASREAIRRQDHWLPAMRFFPAAIRTLPNYILLDYAKRVELLTQCQFGHTPMGSRALRDRSVHF